MHDTKYCANCVLALLPLNQIRKIPRNEISRFIKDSLILISRNLKNIETKGDYFKVDSFYPGFKADLIHQLNKFANLENYAEQELKRDKYEMLVKTAHQIYYYREQLDSSMCKQRLLLHMFDNYPNEVSSYIVTESHTQDIITSKPQIDTNEPLLAALRKNVKSELNEEFKEHQESYTKLINHKQNEIETLQLQMQENLKAKQEVLSVEKDKLVGAIDRIKSLEVSIFNRYNIFFNV